ncbi:hypothetical protein BH10CYA1_BH10CYA1_43350 [soil metagenome]
MACDPLVSLLTASVAAVWDRFMHGQRVEGLWNLVQSFKEPHVALSGLCQTFSLTSRHPPAKRRTRTVAQQETIERQGPGAERRESSAYAGIAAASWNQNYMRLNISDSSKLSVNAIFGNLELIAQASAIEATMPVFKADYTAPDYTHGLEHAKNPEQYTRFYTQQKEAEYLSRTQETNVIAWGPKQVQGPELLANQEPKSSVHHWKTPGKDDHYKGWKPGDAFAPNDFEGWRKSVRSYVADFMKLNHIDKDTPEGELFRNAFQHELAAATFQKQGGAPTIVVDAIGIGQEVYQAGKDILGIYAGASMIEAGGRTANGRLVNDGRKTLKDNSDKLATMFPNDTTIDLANNHKGAELALGAHSWQDLLKKVANSAAQAPTHDGRGQ